MAPQIHDNDYMNAARHGSKISSIGQRLDGICVKDLGYSICTNKVFGVLVTNRTGLRKETNPIEDHVPRCRDKWPRRRDYGIDTGDRLAAF